MQGPILSISQYCKYWHLFVHILRLWIIVSSTLLTGSNTGSQMELETRTRHMGLTHHVPQPPKEKPAKVRVLLFGSDKMWALPITIGQSWPNGWKDRLVTRRLQARFSIPARKWLRCPWGRHRTPNRCSLLWVCASTVCSVCVHYS